MIDEGIITFKAEFFLCLLFYYLNIYLFCAIVIIDNEDISMAKLKTIFPSAYKVCFESLKKLKKTHEFKEKNKHLFKTSDSLML